MQHHTRATFDATELAVVLSHYDLGTIESVTELSRGSRRSPKVGLVCKRGKFLLKRRSIDRAHPDRVRYIHRVQDHLVRAGFPLAPLIPTRDQQHTWVQLREHVYEMFQFMPGQTYARSVAESRGAGSALAWFHQATDTFLPPPSLTHLGGDYHDAPAVRTGLGAIEATLNAHDSFSGHESELLHLTQHLLAGYDRAASTVNALPFASWPRRLIHSDWHPGNLLFRSDAVLAVIDYDSLRFSRRIIDVANGALHFSILAGDDPTDWPDHLDTDRYRAFLDGYDAFVGPPPAPDTAESSVETAPRTAHADPAISSDERLCLPHLMIEALIAECVTPIATTGSVGRWSGFRILQMVRRKLDWISAHANELAQISSAQRASQ